MVSIETLHSTTCINAYIDYIRVTFRIFWLCLSSLPSLLIDTLQHLLVIGFFALFVFWNSGVVLGKRHLLREDSI
jgi:hypothetical protein